MNYQGTEVWSHLHLICGDFYIQVLDICTLNKHFKNYICLSYVTHINYYIENCVCVCLENIEKESDWCFPFILQNKFLEKEDLSVLKQCVIASKII